MFDWQRYVPAGYDHTSFEPGSRVLDVGCGDGVQVRELARRGCRPVGLEVALAPAARALGHGHPILVARGEALPFGRGAFDAAVSKGVLMFTDEERALSEIARIVRAGGGVDLMVNGSGYYLRYALCARSLRHRFYGLRTLLNTWLWQSAGVRLPGFLGDTVYGTRARLLEMCGRHGLAMVRHTASPTFLGLPVFVYLKLQRVSS
jgi:ubiquinone/menaquinone biosynthesis C-methylase UbiE